MFAVFLRDDRPIEISTLSLHDALPISEEMDRHRRAGHLPGGVLRGADPGVERSPEDAGRDQGSRTAAGGRGARSEEHTSELQSRVDLVCRLLLEKKKKKQGGASGSRIN